MSATYMHIGIPVTDLKEGMTYNEDMKLWMSNPDDYDFKIEYLKFEAGTPFPAILHHNPHVAYLVDDIEAYVAKADQVIFPITAASETARLAFVIMDDAIIELYEDKG